MVRQEFVNSSQLQSFFKNPDTRSIFIASHGINDGTLLLNDETNDQLNASDLISVRTHRIPELVLYVCWPMQDASWRSLVTRYTGHVRGSEDKVRPAFTNWSELPSWPGQ